MSHDYISECNLAMTTSDVPLSRGRAQAGDDDQARGLRGGRVLWFTEGESPSLSASF